MTLEVTDRNNSDAAISVVVPTYKEAESIGILIEQVLALGPRYSILIVDDSSPDGTGGIVETLAATRPGRVQLLSRPKKEGIGRAYVAGFRKVLGGDADLIATMDADLSHDPVDLSRLVAATERA